MLAAIGTTDAAFDADEVDVTINGVTVCRGGAIADPREGVDLTGREITIDVDLKAGTEQATIWTTTCPSPTCTKLGLLHMSRD